MAVPKGKEKEEGKETGLLIGFLLLGSLVRDWEGVSGTVSKEAAKGERSKKGKKARKKRRNEKEKKRKKKKENKERKKRKKERNAACSLPLNLFPFELLPG